MKCTVYKTTKHRLLTISVLITALSSCSKIETWLDEKANLNDSRPTTLKDFRAILDYAEDMNLFSPGIGEVGTDNLFLDITAFNRTPELQQNAYLWNEKVFENTAGDWTSGYKKIANANIVLDGLGNIEMNTSNSREYDEIKGTALFFRAFTYYGMAQIFCKPYSDNSLSDLGLPLRSSSDINIKSPRSSLKETYDFIFSDLEAAIPLLPDVSDYQTRPTQNAAWGLLAKIYLCMEDYAKAYQYANMVLTSYDELLDFNDENLVNTATVYRFPVYPSNPEILFWAGENLNTAISPQTVMIGFVDKDFYDSYSDNDLRKVNFFFQAGSNSIKFRGTYTGTNRNFSGIATNEILLIRAECLARQGNITESQRDLNTLLEKRHVLGTYEQINIENPEDLLTMVLKERRKELPFTGQLRWEDLRRLNKDPGFAKTLYRELDGILYTLPPNDNRYTYPLPPDDIQLGGLQQNER